MSIPKNPGGRVIDVNLTGSFLLLKYAVPLMQQAGWGRDPARHIRSRRVGRQFLPAVRIEQRRRPRAGPGGPRTASSSEHPHPRRISGRDGDEHEAGRYPRDGRKSGTLRRRRRARIAPPALSPPEDSAAKLIDLASDAGAAAGDAVTIFDGDWDIETHSLRTPANRRLQ